MWTLKSAFKFNISDHLLGLETAQTCYFDVLNYTFEDIYISPLKNR